MFTHSNGDEQGMGKSVAYEHSFRALGQCGAILESYIRRQGVSPIMMAILPLSILGKSPKWVTVH